MQDVQQTVKKHLYSSIPDYAGHSIRVAEYMLRMQEILIENGNLRFEVWQPDVLWLAGAFHDIGKILVPRELLKKNVALTEDEWAQMRAHTTLSAGFLYKKIQEISDSSRYNEILESCIQTAMFHHERLDGSGYPNGASGAGIPLMARLCAVADTYDALTADCPYRKAVSGERAAQTLLRQAGITLDASIVESVFGENKNLARLSAATSLSSA